MNNLERGSVKIKTAIAAGVLATAAAGAAAVGGAFGRGEQPQPIGTETPSAAAASPTPKETTTPTVKPTETAKPTEVAKVPCVILALEFCNKGELLTSNGKIYIGWKDIPVGTPLSSFLDGERTTVPIITAKNSPFFGQTQLLINTKDSNTFGIFTGRIKLSDNATVKNGQTVATMVEGGNKIWDDYELVFTADEKSLKTMFPTVMAGGVPKQVSTPSGSPTTIITPPDYYNKP